MDLISQRNNTDKVKYSKELLCCLISFFLMLAYVALSVLIVLDTGFLPGAVRQVLGSSHYYENLQKDLYRKTETMTAPTGLSLDVIEEVFPKDEIIREVNEYISASVQGNIYRPAVDTIETRLKQKIESFLLEKEIEPDPEQQRSIEEYITSVGREYERSIGQPLLGFFCTLIRNYQRFHMRWWLMSGGFLMLSLFLLKWLKRERSGFRKYMYCSIMASAWMLLLLPGILLLKPYNAVWLYPRHLNEFALQYSSFLLRKLFSTGMAAMLLSILILLVGGEKSFFGKSPSPGTLSKD